MNIEEQKLFAYLTNPENKLINVWVDHTMGMIELEFENKPKVFIAGADDEIYVEYE